MLDNAIIWLIVLVLTSIAIVIILPKDLPFGNQKVGIKIFIPYAVMMISVAFVPVAAIILDLATTDRQSHISFIKYTWIGVLVSLPTSLLMARIFGTINVDQYWIFLVSFWPHSRRKLVCGWALSSLFFVVVSFLT